MRRPNRNFEIFSMSVLDMFASALGAFIMVTVILFPKFNQQRQLETETAELQKTQLVIGQKKQLLRQEVRKIEHQKEEIKENARSGVALIACKKTAAACEAAVTKTFLVVAIEWKDPYDVDLYVTDPQGHKFFYNSRTHSGSKAELSTDMKDGPGTEIWQDPSAAPGEYLIAYHVFSPAATHPVNITGWVLDRGKGLRVLQAKQLAHTESPVPVFLLRVNEDGSTEIEPTSGP